jgi:hypothetical protein
MLPLHYSWRSSPGENAELSHHGDALESKEPVMVMDRSLKCLRLAVERKFRPLS